MTNPHHSAELIPFAQVHRLVQERRQQRRPAPVVDLQDTGSLVATRTSQVRRLLAEQRAAPPSSGPEAA